MTGWKPENCVFKEVFTGRMVEGRPYKSYEAPGHKACLLIYGVYEPRIGYEIGNFAVLKGPKEKTPIVTGGQAGFYFWLGDENVYWSKNGRYLAFAVLPILKKHKQAYFDITMLLDIKTGRYTLINLAGSMEHAITITGNGKVVIDTRPREIDATRIFPVKNTVNKLSNLRWKDIKTINDAIGLLETGYWGDMIGYKQESLNRRFKNGYVPWFYRKIKEVSGTGGFKPKKMPGA